MALSNSASFGVHENTWGLCVLTHDDLDVASIITSVKRDSCGAIATFIGTTRDNFQGKRVMRLEYQAYSKLAIKTMSEILRDTLHNANTELHCGVVHRLGVVPVGEPSIVIAVSSPHRKEAFTACELILEEVKAKAQIWKREWYDDDGGAEPAWKKNTQA